MNRVEFHPLLRTAAIRWITLYGGKLDAVFGGCKCTARRSNDAALLLLIIKYASVFGGVEIK
jgi:hypothetical protein